MFSWNSRFTTKKRGCRLGQNVTLLLTYSPSPMTNACVAPHGVSSRDSPIRQLIANVIATGRFCRLLNLNLPHQPQASLSELPHFFTSSSQSSSLQLLTQQTNTMADLRGPQQSAYDPERYPHPPPAYGGDSSPLLGSPRTSEDNVSSLDLCSSVQN